MPSVLQFRKLFMLYVLVQSVLAPVFCVLVVLGWIQWRISSNYKAMTVCLVCMYVCPSPFLTTVHSIDFTLGGCIAGDSRKCGVKFGCNWLFHFFNINKLYINKQSSSHSALQQQDIGNCMWWTQSCTVSQRKVSSHGVLGHMIHLILIHFE